ncbi:EAL domain-containing protein [Blastococcus sp. TF02A-26]|uniref:EAL domain-containing protein n=1 Tax=Blastococcus sp. TF02A-26 TaxID=2250577 RepID=UPI001313F849|nr:EAL domain-containing protein [Blastococcus sp. TF02A-26]
MQVEEPVGSGVGGAAQRGELSLAYQPIVGPAGGEPVAVEALVRWRHPRLGLLGPESFLPRLARDGELHLLDDWVLRTATAQFASWRGTAGAPAGIGLSVNVSRARLMSPGLPELLAGAVAAAGLDRSLLDLEVGEALLLDDLHAAADVLGPLTAAGFGITVDDVSAAGTSARHLQAVGARGIKVDRSYVAGLADSARDRAVVRNLVERVTAAGLTVTAVGVETVAQQTALAEMGCPRAQGWLFGRPSPLSELGALPA